MPQGGEQSQQKRRTKSNPGGANNQALYSSTGGRSNTSPDTDGYPEDDIEPLRTNTSSIRLDATQGGRARYTGNPTSSSIPLRRQGNTRNLPRPPRATTEYRDRAPQRPARKVHWLLPVGVTMIAMVVLFVLGSSVLAWGMLRYNDLRYGYPRTYQTDAVVGHNNDSAAHPSHFLAINYNRQAIVIEFMAGDPAKSTSYIAPVYIAGDGGDLAPVTVDFRDVTQDRLPDMLIHIHLPNQDQLSVFVNDGKKFRPSNGNDKIRI